MRLSRTRRHQISLPILLMMVHVLQHSHADDGHRKPDSAESQFNETVTVAYMPTAPSKLFDGELTSTQKTDEIAGQYTLPPIDLSTQITPSESVETVSSAENCGESIEIEITDDEDEEKKPPLNFYEILRESYGTYRSDRSNVTWIPGNGQNFGLVEWNSTPYLERGETSGFTGAMNITWLSGPQSTPLPARVYDISAGFQNRGQLTNLFSYDVATSIGIFSDFEGSAREGVRFPGHAVGMFHLNRSTDLVFGADFLDRDDISVLPVFGLSIRDGRFPRVRMDLIFPRPRIDFNLSHSKRIYLAGQLGGGTWDVDDGIDLVATWRDYRVTMGFENADDDGETSSVELGYVFGRRMELRGQTGHTAFEDAFIVRWVTRK